jgi:hypothetical protein
MIKKDVEFKWNKEEKESFEKKSKFPYPNSLVLCSPYFNLDFLLYTFTSDHSLAVVLMHKNVEGNEVLVSLMSTNLQGV